jgi:predicted small lipoprotein YifL
MTRLMLIVLLLAFAAPLSGCGIKGGLDTPPPLWGEEVSTDTPADAQAQDEDENEGVGYGVDVADQP